MECDLLRFYGIDLLGLYAQPPSLSLRRLAVLIRGLPADAATVRAVSPAARWTTTDYLLAGVLDAVMVANWLTVEVNKRRGSANPRPEPVPRPGTPAPEPKTRKLSGAELAQWLNKVA